MDFAPAAPVQIRGAEGGVDDIAPAGWHAWLADRANLDLLAVASDGKCKATLVFKDQRDAENAQAGMRALQEMHPHGSHPGGRASFLDPDTFNISLVSPGDAVFVEAGLRSEVNNSQ